MGKTSRPLVILVTDPDMLQWPEVREKAAQGHQVGSWLELRQGHTELESADVVFGPNCWRMDARLRRYFTQAVDAARRVRYPGKGKS